METKYRFILIVIRRATIEYKMVHSLGLVLPRDSEYLGHTSNYNTSLCRDVVGGIQNDDNPFGETKSMARQRRESDLSGGM